MNLEQGLSLLLRKMSKCNISQLFINTKIYLKFGNFIIMMVSFGEELCLSKSGTLILFMKIMCNLLKVYDAPFPSKACAVQNIM